MKRNVVDYLLCMYIILRLISYCYYIKKKVVYIILCELLVVLWIFKNFFVLNCVQEGFEYVVMMLEFLYCKQVVFVYIKKIKFVQLLCLLCNYSNYLLYMMVNYEYK